MAAKDVLKEIVAKKKERLAAAKLVLPQEQLQAQLTQLAPVRPFIPAVNKPKNISLIAEIKQQSPSHGVILQEYSPADIAAIYQEAGVQAISVITEEDFFGGNLNHIAEVKSKATVPILRKDFILEPYQIYESRLAQADAVLLIADILSKDMLVELIRLADSLGLACLVEAHDEKELKKILGLKVFPLVPDEKSKKSKPIDFAIGINNRNLHTLEVDIKNTEKLYPLIPKDRTVVVESGLSSYQDILFLKILGVNAVLVGGAILRSQDIKAQIQDLMGW